MNLSRIGLRPLVSSLRHRKSAYASLVIEVALGCTVVAYVLGLSAGIRKLADEPLGFDDTRTFVVAFEHALGGSGAAFEQRVAGERAELRALPGVEAAAFSELPPMSRRELPVTLRTPGGPSRGWELHGDASLLAALGLRVRLGRALDAQDVAANGRPLPVLVTPDLAAKLGPNPLGARLSSPELGALSVVGVIDAPLRLGAFYGGKHCLLVSVARPVEARRTEYVVRTSSAGAARFETAALRTLQADSPARFVAVTRLSEARVVQARNVTGADTIILITVCGMVLVVLVGSLGMASSLVVERTRQIGIRRALGARRSDIVAQFMLESLLATLLGVALGTGLCAGLDVLTSGIKGTLEVRWPEYLPLSAALFLLSGQLAALVPALRAAEVKPSAVSA